VSVALVKPDGGSLKRRCPTCGHDDFETTSGFGGWATTWCRKCKSVVAEEKQ